jgi:hypothetical protein
LICGLSLDRNTGREDFDVEPNISVLRNFRTYKNYKKAKQVGNPNLFLL